MRNKGGESVEVEYTPEFKRNLRILAKKYRHIRSDIQPVLDQLQAGEVIVDKIPQTRHSIFKGIRMTSHQSKFGVL
jgi:mRNA-degrading endonuclease RelE of RelBE toxin-antitoxin system